MAQKHAYRLKMFVFLRTAIFSLLHTRLGGWMESIRLKLTQFEMSLQQSEYD